MTSTDMIIAALTQMGGTAHFDALVAALPAYDAPIISRVVILAKYAGLVVVDLDTRTVSLPEVAA